MTAKSSNKFARKQARANLKIERKRAKAANKANKAAKAAKAASARKPTKAVKPAKARKPRTSAKTPRLPAFLDPTGTESLDVAERQLTLLVRTTAMLTQENSREAPLDRSSYLLLCTLDKQGPSTISTLAAELCLAASTVTRQVATMCDAGLVTSQAHPADRRARVVTMEQHGRELFLAERHRRRRILRAITGNWTEDEWQQLAELLGKLNASLGDLFDGAPPAYEA